MHIRMHVGMLTGSHGGLHGGLRSGMYSGRIAGTRYRDLIACSRQAHHCVMQHNEEPRPLKCILESLARVLRRAGDADRNGVFSDSSQSRNGRVATSGNSPILSLSSVLSTS